MEPIVIGLWAFFGSVVAVYGFAAYRLTKRLIRPNSTPLDHRDETSDETLPQEHGISPIHREIQPRLDAESNYLRSNYLRGKGIYLPYLPNKF